MLKSLFIKNYALIDELKVEFEHGFSVLTGETGAGKSIILGALSLILGERAESKFIKQNANKCTIEGIFDISIYKLKPLFDKNDWVYDGDVCIIRREIWASGKSRAFVNDSPVYLQDLRVLGERLIDIHSQHENLALNDNLFQLNLVDSIATTTELKEHYKSSYKLYKKVERELNELRHQAQEQKKEQDFLQYQFDTLSEANLQEDEQEQLEKELEAITHAEEIKSNLYKLANILSGEEGGVEIGLRSALDAAKSLQRFAATSDFSQGFVERIESAFLDMKDLREDAENIFEKIDFNADRQQVVEDRLSLIYGLQQKYAVATVKELMEILTDIDLKLQSIDSLDERIEVLEKEFSEKERIVYEDAAALSKKRKSSVAKNEKSIEERLKYLGIPNAKFRIEIIDKKELDITGKDSINFLFTANKNTDLQPIAKIASGGEISRLMLVLKSLVADATALATIIFDEVDTGTSGEIADKMGIIMQEMSHRMQVIAITHLPQIAAKGNAHYYVYKEELSDVTATSIKKLTEAERIDEIARMLSGAETTVQALENARVMLKTCQ